MTAPRPATLRGRPACDSRLRGADRARAGAVDHWRHSYDWRRHEAALNAFPQYLIRIDGIDVHFVHVRSSARLALPLILTHGWPMSVVEYLDVIDLLTSNQPDQGSGLRRGHPLDTRIRILRADPRTPPAGAGSGSPAWAELMHRLGYRRDGAHGNDIGGMISLELGRPADPEHVAAVHVTQTFSPCPPPIAVNSPGFPGRDLARSDRSERYSFSENPAPTSPFSPRDRRRSPMP